MWCRSQTKPTNNSNTAITKHNMTTCQKKEQYNVCFDKVFFTLRGGSSCGSGWIILNRGHLAPNLDMGWHHCSAWPLVPPAPKACLHHHECTARGRFVLPWQLEKNPHSVWRFQGFNTSSTEWHKPTKTFSNEQKKELCWKTTAAYCCTTGKFMKQPQPTGPAGCLVRVIGLIRRSPRRDVECFIDSTFQGNRCKKMELLIIDIHIITYLLLTTYVWWYSIRIYLA